MIFKASGRELIYNFPIPSMLNSLMVRQLGFWATRHPTPNRLKGWPGPGHVGDTSPGTKKRRLYSGNMVCFPIQPSPPNPHEHKTERYKNRLTALGNPVCKPSCLHASLYIQKQEWFCSTSFGFFFESLLFPYNHRHSG